MRALVSLSLWHAASAGELGSILSNITKFDPLIPAQHETHIEVGVYFEMLHKVDDVAHTFDAEFFLVYKWHDPRDYSELFHHQEVLERESVTCDSGGSGGSAGSGCGGGRLRRLGGSGSAGSAGSAGSSGSASYSSAGEEYKSGWEVFVEFGEDEMGYVWRPDLQVTNVHSGYNARNKMMRFYEDGTIEYIQLTYARLELLHVRFDAYPFDAHHFAVYVESRSHTKARIVIETLDDLTGIEEAYAEEWPSWQYTGYHSHVEVHRPDYIHSPGGKCRTEARSRLVFVVEATRIDTFIDSAFIPSLLLVITSFVGPFLSLNALMPRIATGFISFLTLSNMMSSQVALLPKISYDVWFIIFMNTQRYYVFSALMETAAAHVVQDRLSTRTAMKLDNYARIALPFSYIVVVTILYVNAPGSTSPAGAMCYQDAVVLLANLWRVVYANFVILFVLGVAWVAFSYQRLMILLRKKPVEVHKASRVHLDKNELHKLFSFIDVDGGKSLDMSESVIMMLGLEDIATEYSSGKVAHAESVTLSRDDCPKEVLEMIAILEKKFGKVLHQESFNASHRAIFSEVDIFCVQHPEMDRVWAEHTARVKGSLDRGSLKDGPPAPVTPSSQAAARAPISPDELKGEVPVAV
jgi:hypothetical protein